MKDPRDCELLRPSLVAMAYEEPHPEQGMLLEHLPRCPSCRQELAELRAVRSLLEAALVPTAGRSRPPAGSTPELLWKAVPCLAAVCLAAALFLVGRGESGGQGPGRSEPGLPSGWKAAPAALEFGGVELDRHLEWVGLDVRALGALGGDSW